MYDIDFNNVGEIFTIYNEKVLTYMISAYYLQYRSSSSLIRLVKPIGKLQEMKEEPAKAAPQESKDEPAKAPLPSATSIRDVDVVESISIPAEGSVPEKNKDKKNTPSISDYNRVVPPSTPVDETQVKTVNQQLEKPASKTVRFKNEVRPKRTLKEVKLIRHVTSILSQILYKHYYMHVLV